MTMVRLDNFTELAQIQLRNAMARCCIEGPTPSWASMNGSTAFVRAMPLNVYDTNSEVVVEAALPGYTPEQIETSIERGQLTIHARAPEVAEEDGVQYFHREIMPQEVVRSVSLPNGLQEDKVEATFEHGILKLRVPKAEESKPKQITIKAARSTNKK